MMTPNSDNKAGARSARTTPFAITKSIMKSADSAVITSQTSIYRVHPPSPRFRPRNEKFTRRPTRPTVRKRKFCTSEL